MSSGNSCWLTEVILTLPVLSKSEFEINCGLAGAGVFSSVLSLHAERMSAETKNTVAIFTKFMGRILIESIFV